MLSPSYNQGQSISNGGQVARYLQQKCMKRSQRWRCAPRWRVSRFRKRWTPSISNSSLHPSEPDPRPGYRPLSGERRQRPLARPTRRRENALGRRARPEACEHGIKLQPPVRVAIALVSRPVRLVLRLGAVALTIVPVTVRQSCFTINRVGLYTWVQRLSPQPATLGEPATPEPS
jgi:hypothetical protein